MNSLEPDIDELIENGDVEGLIRALYDDDYITRKEATFGLKKVGDKRAVEHLINSLLYKNWHKDYTILTGVRENSAEALGMIGEESAIDALIQALEEDPDEEVRWKAVWVLGEIGNIQVTEALIKALKDNDWTVRRHAANSLGMIGDEEAVPSIIKALNDRDWHVRKYAAVALGKMKDERAIPILLEALDDDDADVRWKAASSLVKMGEISVPLVINVFKTGSWRVRGRAAEILGKIGDERAVPVLIDSLSHGKSLEKHRHVRGKAAEALGNIGDKVALDILLKTFHEDEYKYVQDKAEEAINKIRKTAKERSILTYDNGEVSFNYPGEWDLMDTPDPKKIVKGYYANSAINLSLNRQADVEDISSDEFAEMLRNVLSIQNSTIISEDMFNRDGMEVYQVVAENNEVVPTDILAVSYKKLGLLYYLWFAGDPEVLKHAEEGIQIMLDTFYIY
ncbi:MAG TPA: HEAT repeat domain-containing protein [Methanobacteriaceae archaeon]|nr:HEAT repeat domain-containing protein [Methanobacteriaceae archaeon]